MNPQRVRRRTEELFAGNQLMCAETILHVFNEELGRPLPPKAVKLASGFPAGFSATSASDCCCGAFIGAVMVLGLAYGRSEPGAVAPEVMEKTREFRDWFTERFGSTRCSQLVADMKWASPEHVQYCVKITADTAEHLAELIGG